jgi:hypothetical protein
MPALSCVSILSMEIFSAGLVGSIPTDIGTGKALSPPSYQPVAGHPLPIIPQRILLEENAFLLKECL